MVPQHVLVTAPHPQSAAALVLLNADYERQDLTRCSHTVWLRFRDTVFHQLQHNRSKLTCHICGMTNLNPWLSGQSRQLATLDHIVPKSSNRSLTFDPQNLTVACVRCNNKRGAKPLQSGHTVTRISDQLTLDQRNYLGKSLIAMTAPKLSFR